MSDSVSVDVAAPADAPAPITPAPNTQPALSISDAARMLRSARQAAAAEPEATAPPPAQEAAPERSEAPRRRSGVEAMERALGLRPGEQNAPPAENGEAAPPAAGDFELDGRRWTHDQLREQLRLAGDYTYKTQEVGRQRQELDTQRQQLQAQQNALSQFLPLIQPEVARLQAMLADAPMPDPNLRQIDPAAYWDQFARHQEANAAQQRFINMQQQQEQARNQMLTQAVNEGLSVLAQKYPVWADPQQRGEYQDALRTWAKSQGYTEQELTGLSNPRYVETMMKAFAWDNQVQGTRTEAPTRRSASAPPRGAPPPPRATEQLAAAEAAFEQKPDWRRGAALLSAQQAAGRRGNGHSNW